MDTLSCSFYKWGDRPREIKQLAQSHTASERWRICLTSADTKPCSFNLWAILLWVVCIKHKGCGNQEESLTRVGCLGAGRSEGEQDLCDGWHRSWIKRSQAEEGGWAGQRNAHRSWGTRWSCIQTPVILLATSEFWLSPCLAPERRASDWKATKYSLVSNILVRSVRALGFQGTCRASLFFKKNPLFVYF